ncbi:MAG: AsmA family protein [Candidatus Acidiferrales bacterium]
MALTTPAMVLTTPAPSPSSQPRRPWRWLGWLLVFLVLIGCLDSALSFIFEHTRMRDVVTSRLEAAFGRPVQAADYSFSLWEGPVLEADSVTVGEDPRFGYEYFLRADSLQARFRWLPLLRGRIELGTLSFTRPSLNLVRASNGDWNIEAWLPRPASGQIGTAPALPTAPGAWARSRLRRIEVQAGRINFKRGVEKLPYAFNSVEGSLEQESSGSWRVDLEAAPWRAATILQQAGTLRVQGHLGGTSSRLRPADLELSWRNGSLSDLLRLIRGYDYGIRATFMLSMRAHSDAEPWELQGRSEIRGIHRWDLPSRQDNPLLNVEASGRWLPQESRLELADVLLEAPQSKVTAKGVLDWNGRSPRYPITPETELSVSTQWIAARDLLGWLRAFRAGVADDAAVTGGVEATADLSGWPPKIDRGLVQSDGIAWTSAQTLVNAHLPRVTADITRDRVRLAPAQILLNSGASSVRIGGTIEPVVVAPASSAAGAAKSPTVAADPPYRFQVSAQFAGQFADAREGTDLAGTLGWALPAGWGLTGPAHFDLRWQSNLAGTAAAAGLPAPAGFAATARGFIETTGITLRAPFLSEPVGPIRARMEYTAQGRHILLTSAQAFGTRWTGSFDRSNSASDWQYALRGDHLTAANLDRALNPQHRAGLLQRVFPFLGSSAGAEVVPSALRGKGILEIEQFNLGSVVLRRLTANSSIDGRRLELSAAQADFYGGTVHGSLRAQLVALPSYEVESNFTQVNLASLSGANPALAHQFEGLASGNVLIRAHGTGRSALLDSLECRGQAEVEQAELHGVDLAESLRQGEAQPGATAMPQLDAAFTCQAQKVQFSRLRFSLGGPEHYSARGSVDFQRSADLQIRVLSLDEPESPDSTGAVRTTIATTAPSARFQGLIFDPEISLLKLAPAEKPGP